MTQKDKIRLKIYGFTGTVGFNCQSCDRPILINLSDLEGPFTCRGCGERIVVPPIYCCNESCDGTYVKCNGLIVKLSKQELEKEESAAWEGETLSGSPTDSNHDDYRDIVGSIISSRCTNCGEKYTAREGHMHGEFRNERCKQMICNKCKQRPKYYEVSPTTETK